MGKTSDAIRSETAIADPKMREALATYAASLDESQAEHLLGSLRRDAKSVANGSTPRAVAADMALAVQIRPEAAKPVIVQMLGEQKSAELLKRLDAANGVTRETIERDRQENEGIFTRWKPSGTFISAAAKPQENALDDLREAVQSAMQSSLKPLPTPGVSASAAAKGK